MKRMTPALLTLAVIGLSACQQPVQTVNDPTGAEVATPTNTPAPSRLGDSTQAEVVVGTSGVGAAVRVGNGPVTVGFGRGNIGGFWF